MTLIDDRTSELAEKAARVPRKSQQRARRGVDEVRPEPAGGVHLLAEV